MDRFHFKILIFLKTFLSSLRYSGIETLQYYSFSVSGEAEFRNMSRKRVKSLKKPHNDDTISSKFVTLHPGLSIKHSLDPHLAFVRI